MYRIRCTFAILKRNGECLYCFSLASLKNCHVLSSYKPSSLFSHCFSPTSSSDDYKSRVNIKTCAGWPENRFFFFCTVSKNNIYLLHKSVGRTCALNIVIVIITIILFLFIFYCVLSFWLKAERWTSIVDRRTGPWALHALAYNA